MSDSHVAARTGLFYALAAYGLWGVVPLYFKALAHIRPLELLAQRIVWSVVVLTGLLTFTRSWPEVRACLRSAPVMWRLGATTLLISLNWLTFIYAVWSSQVLQASLGYFITPLVNVLLGMVFLQERLRPAQWLAVGLAVLGVVMLTVAVGELPWIALTLAISFGLYGLLRKTVAVNALVGLSVETMLLALPSAGWVVYLGVQGSGAMGNTDAATDLLLVASGFVTTVPLLCFVQAARRLRLSTLGFVQYLSPSLSFALAVGVFGEAFGPAQLASFSCIWLALAIFTVESVRAYRQRLAELTDPPALSVPVPGEPG